MLEDLENTAAIKNCIDSSKISKVIESDYIERLQLRHFLLCNILPCVGFIIAIVSLWRNSIGSIEVGLLFGMLTLTAIGITVGFHRHFTHRSFQSSGIIRVILAILGSMAAQGPLISWVAIHRRHHEYSDRSGDLHSPNLYGSDFKGRLRGLWHTYFNWMIRHPYPIAAYYAPELLRDKVIAKVSQLYFAWLLLGLLIPTIWAGILTGTLKGALLGFLWGGLVRIFLLGNIIGSINSFCHVFGSSPFDTGDQSTNNVWLAIPSLGLGECWHNNHHAFQSSAKVGLQWWQIDLGYWVIRILEIAGLAWDVKVPTAKMIETMKQEASIP